MKMSVFFVSYSLLISIPFAPKILLSVCFDCLVSVNLFPIGGRLDRMSVCFYFLVSVNLVVCQWASKLHASLLLLSCVCDFVSSTDSHDVCWHSLP